MEVEVGGKINGTPRVLRRARFPLGFQRYERRLTRVEHRRKCENSREGREGGGGGGGFPGGSRAKRPCLLFGYFGGGGAVISTKAATRSQETTQELSRHVWDALKRIGGLK